MITRLQFATCSEFLILSALFLLRSFALGQDDQAKRKAIDQLRRVADAMKQCPEQKSTYQNECRIRYSYAGPPTNLEWDVVPSKTVRSPFQGIIEFTLPSHYQEIAPQNQSAKVHQQCAANEFINPSALLEMQKEIAEKGPKWRDGHYRYEFDVGSDSPELVKMLWVATDRANTIITLPVDRCREAGCADPEAAIQSDRPECWVKEARAIKP